MAAYAGPGPGPGPGTGPGPAIGTALRADLPAKRAGPAKKAGPGKKTEPAKKAGPAGAWLALPRCPDPVVTPHSHTGTL